MPAELLAKIDIMERIVSRAVNTEFRNLSSFFLFLDPFLLSFPCLAFLGFVAFPSAVKLAECTKRETLLLLTFCLSYPHLWNGFCLVFFSARPFPFPCFDYGAAYGVSRRSHLVSKISCQVWMNARRSPHGLDRGHRTFFVAKPSDLFFS